MMSLIHTIVAEDVCKTLIPRQCSSCGAKRPILIGWAIGRVQRGDIGKRVYDNNGVIQVENDEQRNSRLSCERLVDEQIAHGPASEFTDDERSARVERLTR